MAKYSVSVRAIYDEGYSVEASSPEEAIEKLWKYGQMEGCYEESYKYREEHKIEFTDKGYFVKFTDKEEWEAETDEEEEILDE